MVGDGGTPGFSSSVTQFSPGHQARWWGGETSWTWRWSLINVLPSCFLDVFSLRILLHIAWVHLILKNSPTGAKRLGSSVESAQSSPSCVHLLIFVIFALRACSYSASCVHNQRYIVHRTSSWENFHKKVCFRLSSPSSPGSPHLPPPRRCNYCMKCNFPRDSPSGRRIRGGGGGLAVNIGGAVLHLP